ncbi:Swt1 family HEPN domain-containing protein [Undibacterium aquatile]|uniref:Swt1 family HEPN domain-containing protein n=1 Tax=Undibacterium aquatile TaxID=1537398 RepID=UPI001CC269B7|nr:Swt1 family HEPN domain-containing protein [Undibacterium aquatile]
MKHKELRDFLFRGLLFEAEASVFQKAGIKIGADQTETEERLLAEALAAFPVNLRNNALEMARLYAVLFSFENHVREFIRQTLSENEGVDWIDKLPQKVKQHAETRQQTAHQDSWLEGEKTDLLGFLDFGHLAQVILNKWEHFESIIPSQHWLKQRMDELEKSRNFIAHNRMLLPSEFQRMYMYIADWNRVVGL